MANAFFSRLTHSLRNWRRRSSPPKRPLAPRELALETLEERVNPSGFNAFQGADGILVITSVNPGDGELLIQKGGSPNQVNLVSTTGLIFDIANNILAKNVTMTFANPANHLK